MSRRDSGTRLSESEKSFLVANGYVNLGVLLTPRQLDSVRARVAALLAEEGDSAGAELFDSPNIRHPKEAGADRLADLVNKGAEFDVFHTHPKVLDGVGHMLGQFQLSSLNYRAAKPGTGQQNLHTDWHESVEEGQYRVCNSIWLLDDFCVANGATRLVPGTHRCGKLPEEALADPMLPAANEIILEAKAGTVVLFNAHLWHGGTQNKTNHPRRAIHSYFCQRTQSQQLDQAKYITSETRKRLTSADLERLGIS